MMSSHWSLNSRNSQHSYENFLCQRAFTYSTSLYQIRINEARVISELAVQILLT